jgi:hypothetical protein
MSEHINTSAFEKQPTPPFTITVRKDLSLKEMTTIYNSGYYIDRSAHIGNQYASNMVVLAAAIPTLFNDRTIPNRDTNYHPALQIQSSESRVIVAADQMNRITRNISTTDGIDLYAAHQENLTALYPQTSIHKLSDLMRKNSAIACEIIKTMEFNPLFFARKVSPEGVIQNIQPRNQKELLENLLDLSNQDEGFICKVEILVLLLSIFGYIDKQNGDKPGKTGRIFHISGPDMIKYFPNEQNQQLLSKLYSHIRIHSELLASRLPEVMEFVLLPSYHLRLAVPYSQKDLLDELLSIKKDTELLKIRRGSSMRAENDPDSKRRLIETFNLEQKNLDNAEIEIVLQLGPQLFPLLAEAKHFTQYDALADGLYIPEYLYTAKALEIETYLARLQKMYIKNA